MDQLKKFSIFSIKWEDNITMSRVPKIIHYAWFGGASKPKYLLDNIKSWEKYMPDYEIKEWNEKNWNVNKNAFSCYFAEKKLWGFVSDPLRLDVLNEFGGIYLDTDVYITQSLKPFEELPLFLSMHFSNAIGTALIGSEKANPVIADLVDYYDSLTVEQIENKDFDPVSNGIFTRYFINKYDEFKFTNRKQILNDGTIIFPNYTFVVPTYNRKNNFAIHQLKATWQKENVNSEYNDQKLFFLKKRFKKIINYFYFGKIILIKYSLWKQSKENSLAKQFGVNGTPRRYDNDL